MQVRDVSNYAQWFVGNAGVVRFKLAVALGEPHCSNCRSTTSTYFVDLMECQKMAVPALSKVLQEAVKSLIGPYKGGLHANEIVRGINALDFSNDDSSKLTAHIPAHFDLLDRAIAQIDDNQFAALKTALMAAKDHLHWKVDDGEYYANGADVGEGYKNGNMHTLLIGPENAVVTSDKYLLGLFLLAPQTLYRDHKHLAPELYVTLTGPTAWRVELGEWDEHGAGHRLFNPSNIAHATRVDETPFLALFAWELSAEPSICAVVKLMIGMRLKKNWLSPVKVMAI